MLSKSWYIAVAIFAAGIVGILFLTNRIPFSEWRVVQATAPSYAWREATSSAEWRARDSAESFVFAGRMWLVGGINADAEVNTEAHYVQYWKAPHFNDIWSTADGVTWEQSSTTAAWPPRRSMSIVEYRGALFMFGGWSPVGSYQSDIWRSEDAVHWTKEGEAPWPAREGQTAVIYRDRLYMMGGVNYDAREEKNDVWYTDDGFNWTEAVEHAPWEPRWDHAAAVFNDKIYLIAGMDLHENVFEDIWTTEDGTHWQEASSTPLWQTRQGSVLVPFDGALWLIGRLNDDIYGGTNDMWYTRDGINWTEWSHNLPWIGREDHSVSVFKDSIWIFGGMGADWHWRGDVWAFGTSTTF